MTVTTALDRVRGLRLDVADLPLWATATGLLALTAVSLWIRTRVLGAGFWIDEGLSVGIAHHPLTAIPHLLREDGSPPLYYLLLHVWIGFLGVAGTYRKNDSIDVVYSVNGRRVVSTLKPVAPR